MTVFGYIIFAFLLIALNAFFVLAEFAIVKIRPTQIAHLAAKGNKTARHIQKILGNLDEYLSVSQVGITLTSIGLGFVGEPGFAALLHPLLGWTGFIPEALIEALAITMGFLIVSYLHIVLGELVPKSVAIRITEKAVFFIAGPITFFRWLFIVPIKVLNGTVNLLLKPFRMGASGGHALHSEDEIRTILGESEESGVMSFRRLLYLENVLDLGALTVRNAMHVKSKIKTLDSRMGPDEVFKVLSAHRYSRYPLLDGDAPGPLGFIHVKDLYFSGASATSLAGMRLIDVARPALKAREADPLEQVLATMQRTGNHVAFVYDANGTWCGMVTLEDVIEEVLGTIEEEYPVEDPITLSNYLKPRHVLLDMPGASVAEAIRNSLSRVPQKDLPLSAPVLFERIMERERQGGSFIGRHLAIPHGRLDGLADPMVIVARLKEPIPMPNFPVAQPGGDSVKILFILLTPATTPRIHQVLLSHIALMYDSDFLEDRLYEAESAQELHDIIATAEQVTLA
jgi:CBS domain containing-hemolysin-like protein/mannitol/fructose-specific phosphotransferase system IIA component